LPQRQHEAPSSRAPALADSPPPDENYITCSARKGSPDRRDERHTGMKAHWRLANLVGVK